MPASVSSLPAPILFLGNLGEDLRKEGDSALAEIFPIVGCTTYGPVFHFVSVISKLIKSILKMSALSALVLIANGTEEMELSVSFSPFVHRYQLTPRHPPAPSRTTLSYVPASAAPPLSSLPPRNQHLTQGLSSSLAPGASSFALMHFSIRRSIPPFVLLSS